MNNEKNKIIFPDSLIRFIRFCKDNNLYNYIKSKYININSLNNAIKTLYVENYILGTLNFIPSKYAEIYNLDEHHIKEYDLKWREFAKDMIKDDDKKLINMSDFYKRFYNAKMMNSYSSIMDYGLSFDDLLFYNI